MVYVLGGWQSDFASNWTRQGMDILAGFTQTVQQGLAVTGLDAAEVDCGHVGNFVAELFVGQGLLGGFFGHADPGFDGMPTARHEAACASGSLAVQAAMADIEAGRHGLACVVGLELMRNVPGVTAADHLGAACLRGQEFTDCRYVWPQAFSDLADEYERRYGLDPAHLWRIAEVNFTNARRNPNAQTRNWTFTDRSFTDDAEANPFVEGRTRKMECGQVTDGAAVLFLASPERAADYARRRGIALSDLPRITGWGHRSAAIGYRRKLADGAGAEHVFPQVRRAILDARQRAGITDLSQIHAVETHDCFAMTEYMAIDHLGLTAPGEAWKAVEEGAIEMGGRLPINPSGGLIGLGHPVGATGVRMVLDAARQVTGMAGGYQVEGARAVQTLNIGGSTTTTVSFIVERRAA
ncbi:acetyl-CoA acetyltransferase [Niveispirillum fermenti]|uniref:acetyl-CoA acetyltransferase n=1 Tax=Niveispirillum fermenti TaxID=1233113 RepID=UPI003A8B2878